MERLIRLAVLGTGAYRSLKILKDGVVDFEILVFYSVIGVLELFTIYLEWLVSWFPFYFYLKSALLVLVIIQRLRIPRIIFHTTIIPGMTAAHQRLSKELPGLLEMLQTAPYILLQITINLLFPGLLSAWNASPSDSKEACTESSPILTDEALDGVAGTPKRPEEDGQKEGIMALRERARKNRTARDIKALSMRHQGVIRDVATPSSESKVSEQDAETTKESSDSGKKVEDAPSSEQNERTPRGRARVRCSPRRFVTPDRILRRQNHSQPSSPDSYFGSLARSVLCGSEEVSLRDHLFDLSLPPPPRMSVALNYAEDISSVHVATSAPNSPPSPLPDTRGTSRRSHSNIGAFKERPSRTSNHSSSTVSTRLRSESTRSKKSEAEDPTISPSHGLAARRSRSVVSGRVSSSPVSLRRRVIASRDRSSKKSPQCPSSSPSSSPNRHSTTVEAGKNRRGRTFERKPERSSDVPPPPPHLRNVPSSGYGQLRRGRSAARNTGTAAAELRRRRLLTRYDARGSVVGSLNELDDVVKQQPEPEENSDCGGLSEDESMID